MDTPQAVPEQVGLLRREQPSALHPLSGLAMLGLDWLLFGSEALSDFLLEPWLVPIGAVLGFIATFAIERFYARRGWKRSLLAAIFGGCVVGAPLPVGGTVVGLLVIALSGLRRTAKLLKR